MKALLILIAVLMLGCAAATDDIDTIVPAQQERVHGLYIEIEMFTDQQLLLLYEASVEWSRMTDGRARVEWLGESPGPDDDGKGTANWVVPERSHCQPPGVGCAFYYPPEKGIEFIDWGEPWGSGLFYAVALHELGHYLGEWEHSERTEDVMNAGVGDQENLTANDVRMWCQLTGSDSQVCNVFR